MKKKKKKTKKPKKERKKGGVTRWLANYKRNAKPD
jgi:hypothetical protein